MIVGEVVSECRRTAHAQARMMSQSAFPPRARTGKLEAQGDFSMGRTAS
jgi:hypothetical protein